jgi:hypothetical protein
VRICMSLAGRTCTREIAPRATHFAVFAIYISRGVGSRDHLHHQTKSTPPSNEGTKR